MSNDKKRPKPEPIHTADLQQPGDDLGKQVDRRAQQILNRKKAGLN